MMDTIGTELGVGIVSVHVRVTCVSVRMRSESRS